MTIRGVIFDLDGTLLDTLGDLTDSMNAALRRLGAPEHPADAYRHFVGDGVEMLVRRALPEDRRDDAAVRAGAAAMREEYAKRWNVKTRPYPGVPELLDALSADDVPMAVLSNKPERFTRMCVEEFLSGWRFAEIRGAREGVPKKPDPRSALETAEVLGVPAAEVHYLGDTDTDMRTAVAAGMIPVGVLWGFRDETELRASGARILLSRPEELLAR